MPGEIRVDIIKATSGLGTITLGSSALSISGNLGIGTTNPQSALDVRGGIRATSINNGQLGGSRNIIINGSMMVNQRGFTGAAGTSTSNAYAIDRFVIQRNHDGVVSVGQTSMNSTVGGAAYADGFQNALILRVTTADTSLAAGQYQTIEQRIEGYNLQGIKKGTANALPVTLSFWVRSTTTGTYINEIRDEVNGRTVSQAYTINAANTWEKKTLTFPADTTGVFANDANLAVYLYWWLAAGSDYSGGTLNTSWATNTDANRAVGQTNLLATAGNNFWLTGVQLEVGDRATEFERRSYGDELRLCERYCQKYSGGRIGIGNWASGTIAYCTTIFRTPFRATPSIHSYTAGNVLVENVSWYAATSVAIVEGSSDTATFYITGITNSSQAANANATWGNGASVVLQAEL